MQALSCFLTTTLGGSPAEILSVFLPALYDKRTPKMGVAMARSNLVPEPPSILVAPAERC